ncbi:hypothetical protein B0I35DRAFT_474269 [Stachybotrys elegans]|uniref:NACHT domain-containing protein n=1 Tax=Stachybotrys elegans TaxID=80388 RepID=A0A8K0T7U9_9HYPO|nr:hypothetical protein B0I35DRAFT_474269 [Stachybotrys elegans]
MERPHFLHAGNRIAGALHNHGVALQGNNIQGAVVFGDKRDSKEEECKRALFLTNPIDDRGSITTAKPKLIPKVCEWIRGHPNFKSWIDRTPESQLLWISGGSGMGKTMMSLFLLGEIEKDLDVARNSTILFYFVDTRNEKRNTAVAVLRGLIYLLLQSRPALIGHLMSDFEYQKEALFSQNSLEALWRIFQAMMKDPATGRVYCLVDGLDECKGDSLRPLLRKVVDFFEDQQHLQELARGGCQSLPMASLKMILISREAPACLLVNLARFPRVQIGVTTTFELESDSDLGRNPTRSGARSAPKLSTIAWLVLERKRLEQAGTNSIARNAVTIESVEKDLSCLTIVGQRDASSFTNSVRPSPPTLPPRPGNEPVASEVTLTSRHLLDQDAGEAYVFDETVGDEAGYADETYAVAGGGDFHQQVQPLLVYIEEKVAELARDRSYSNELQSSPTTGLHGKGDGTFLWVDLAIEELKWCDSQHAEKVVEHLLSNVDDMYYRALQRIPDNMVQLAVVTLSWVIAARRPLTVQELATALALIGFPSYNPVEQAVATCGPLLSFGEDNSIHITHASVKDFLTTKSGPLWATPDLHHYHVNVEDVDGEMASLCIHYLEQGCLNRGAVSRVDDETKFNQRLMEFPLLLYATVFWPDHLRSASTPHIDLSSPFFVTNSAIRKNWWNSYYPKGAFLAPANFTLLHLAAYLNLPFIAAQLQMKGELRSRLNIPNSHGNTPIALAAANGSMDMFVFLVKQGVLHEVFGDNVFELACRKGQVEIARYLLNMGYNVDFRTQEVGVIQALGMGLRWIHGVRHRLRGNAAALGSGETPLHSACLYGHTRVVELLLSRGADVHAATTKRWTALHNAAWTGQTDCVTMLLGSGARALDVTSSGWNPMPCAASRGKMPLVSFFLDLGVSVDELTAKYKSALHLASYNGNAATMKVLLKAGAKVDMQSHKGETPLHLAARNAKPEAAETLLAWGANKMLVNRSGETAADTVKTSSGEDYQEVLRILETFGLPGYKRLEAIESEIISRDISIEFRQLDEDASSISRPQDSSCWKNLQGG